MSEDMIKREFPAELLPSGDGRTLDVRIIPYRTIQRVSDDGGRSFYDEEWLPGAFDKQLSAANRVDVLANFEHQQGISGVVARGTELRDSEDALEGTFRMLNHSDSDKALELVNEGVLTGVSIEAIPLKARRQNGVVQRVKARLVNIALCRSPAFKDAQVLAVREQQESKDETPTVTVNVHGSVVDEGAFVDAVRKGLANPELNPELLRAKKSSSAAAAKKEPEEPVEEPVEEPAEEPGVETQPEDEPREEPGVEAQPEDEPIEEGPPTDEPQGEQEARWPFRTTDQTAADEALQRMGYQPLVIRAITRRPWDGSPARFTDEQYKRSCLIDRGGDAPVKERCSLPILEPNGDVNANALSAAAGALAGARAGLAGVSSEQKSAAARKLMRLFRQANMDPPRSLQTLAAR